MGAEAHTGDLKRLDFIRSYSSYALDKTYGLASNVYDTGKQYAPASLKPRIKAMEEKVTEVGSPLVSKLQDRSDFVLHTLDGKARPARACSCLLLGIGVLWDCLPAVSVSGVPRNAAAGVSFQLPTLPVCMNVSEPGLCPHRWTACSAPRTRCMTAPRRSCSRTSTTRRSSMRKTWSTTSRRARPT